MKRVLIANRGEIAVRIVAACRNLGLESVAVYSDADANSFHALQADRAVRIGPPAAVDSYLNQQSLLHVAKSLDCDAIHPGYGFLSENPDFVELCETENVKFIGPSAAVIRRMGDKSLARNQAVACGVPVVLGSEQAFSEATAALEIAATIGFPVLLKARAGGGGRGMRIVNSEKDFVSLFAQASAEADAAFKNRELYLEKYLDSIRHIEVQILGDETGAVLDLGERDCTIQRRHQKLVEEAPCDVINESLRNELRRCATRIGEAVGYRGAGTVEFVVDASSGDYYFIEMNTRIQVEHPVTEMIFGTDLIEAQLQMAMGKRVSELVKNDTADGHAIEFRINAEDWQNNFRPSPGVVRGWRPAAGCGIRVDSHVYEGFEISPYYDSMIAKLLVHGRDRSHTLERAAYALRDFEVKGLNTTIGFHAALLEQQDFCSGNTSTKWVEETFLPN